MLQFLRFLPLLFAVFPSVLCAQFPTAIGTKWEFVQFREDYFIAPDMIPSWEDEVVADTVAGGQTYQVVRRTGHLYSGFGVVPTSSYDTLDGTYYYRVQGDQVWVLDSVVSGNAHESLLYEFGLSVGDSLQGRIKNVINLTPRGRIPFTYPSYYDYDIVCAQSICDSAFELTSHPGISPWLPACMLWQPNTNNFFLPGIGTIFSNPLELVLDVFGQYYLLGQLTSNGQVLYRNGLFVGVASALPSDVLHVSPNPATDQVRVSSDLLFEEIKVLDATGRAVRTHIPEAWPLETILDLTDLPRGLYWVMAQFETGIATRAVLLR